MAHPLPVTISLGGIGAAEALSGFGGAAHIMIARTTTAIARIPRLNASPGSCAISASWRQVDELDFREGKRERCVTLFTPARNRSLDGSADRQAGAGVAPAPPATKGGG